MKTRILLVDDNADFLDSTKDVLEDAGYQVDVATNGVDALNQELNAPFDVVLMDIKMPGMNGVETFIQMKKNNPHVRVVLFTAYALEDLVEEARNEGVCEVLNKPLDMEKLLGTINPDKKSPEGGVHPACQRRSRAVRRSFRCSVPAGVSCGRSVRWARGCGQGQA
jgi:CheY-like chemotaxis protein